MDREPIEEDAHASDLDRFEATGFVGWLIQAAAATVIGVAPWTSYLGFSSLMDLRPRDFNEQMMTDYAVPMLIGGAAAGLGALIAVLAAWAGRPLGVPVLLGLGAVIGTAVAWLRMGEPEPGLLFGTACGLAGAGAAAFVRSRHLR